MFAQELLFFPYQILHGFAIMAKALESARSQSLGMVQGTSSFKVREIVTKVKNWSSMVRSARTARSW